MRILLAIVAVAGALAATAPGAEAGRRSWRDPRAPFAAVPPLYAYRPYYHRPYNYRLYRRGGGVCQERARHFDPNRTFGGFPCWAREAFGQGRR